MKILQKHKLRYWFAAFLFCFTFIIAIVGPIYSTRVVHAIPDVTCPGGSKADKDGNCKQDLEGVGSISVNPDSGKCTGDKFHVVVSIPNPLSWFVCAITNTAGSGLAMLNSAVKDMFYFDPINGTSPNEKATTSSLKGIWNNVLNIANIIFVLGLLIIIISQALDFSIFSNYTIKKMVPKLLLGIVLANLSWVFCGVLIHFFNLMGNLIGGFILQPLTHQFNSGINPTLATSKTTHIDLKGGTNTIIGTIISNVIIALILNPSAAIILILLIFVVGIIIAIIAFFTLALRRVLIVVLIVVAPLACAAWALPGGDKWFGKWWKLFLEMLVMYVFIEAFIALGIFVAALMLMTPIFSSSSDLLKDVINQVNSLIALVVLLVPYAMLPMAFKMSSKTLGGVHGAIQGKMTGAVKGKAKEAYGRTGFANDRKNRKGLADADRQEMSQSRVRQRAAATGKLGRRHIRPETAQRLDLQQKDYEKKQLEMKQMGADFDVAKKAREAPDQKAFKENLAAEFARPETSSERRRAIGKHLQENSAYDEYGSMQESVAQAMVDPGVSEPEKQRLAMDMGTTAQDGWGKTKGDMPGMAVTNSATEVRQWGSQTGDQLETKRGEAISKIKVTDFARAKPGAMNQLDSTWGGKNANGQTAQEFYKQETRSAGPNDSRTIKDVMAQFAAANAQPPVHGPPPPPPSAGTPSPDTPRIIRPGDPDFHK